MYPFASLERSGALLTAGSDYPFTPLDPFDAIEVGLTRRDPHDPSSPPLVAEEALTLETLLAAVPGARAALLLDSQGELVVGAGDLGETERLIGAYSGITLGMALRSAERSSAGGIDHIVWRHDHGSIVICPIKDGYYIALFLGPEALVAAGVRRAREARTPLDEEI